MQAPHPCPLEEEVILAFHDGEPGSAPAELAAHLETCPSCRRALKEVRELEALVATHTIREISEEEADAFLSFLKPKALERKGLPLGISRLAALFLGALVLSWTALRPIPKPSPPDLLAGPLLDLPAGFRFAVSAERKTSWTRGEILSALKRGKDQVAQPDASAPPTQVLAREAIRFVREGEKWERILPAARWLLEEAPAQVRRRALPHLERRLLQGNGEERLALADLFRRRERLFFPPMESKKKPTLPSSRLAGALGYAGALKRLASAPFPLQDAAATEALRTGDEPCLTFLLNLYLEGSIRSSNTRKEGGKWFKNLTPRNAVALLLLEKKMKKKRKKYPAPLLEELKRLLGPLTLRAGGGL